MSLHKIEAHIANEVLEQFVKAIFLLPNKIFSLEKKTLFLHLEDVVDLACGLYLVPLIGAEVCAPDGHRRLLLLLVVTHRAGLAAGALPVNEENIHPALRAERGVVLGE